MRAADYYRRRFEWLEQIAADRELTPSAREAALTLAVRYFNRDRFQEAGHLVAWPAYATLARDIGRSVRATIAAVGDLIERGHLAAPSSTRGGRGVSNEYRALIKSEASFTVSGREKGEVEQQKRVKLASPDSDSKTLIERESAYALSPRAGARVSEPRLRSSSKISGISEAVEAWNRIADELGLAPVKNLSKRRRGRLGACLKLVGIDGWRQALDQIRRSPFLTGGGPNAWRASFDWITAQDHLSATMEGGYADVDRPAPAHELRSGSSTNVIRLAKQVRDEIKARGGR